MSYSINESSAPAERREFCIYIDTLCQGVTLAVREEGWPCVFETEREAHREIVDVCVDDSSQAIHGRNLGVCLRLIACDGWAEGSANRRPGMGGGGLLSRKRGRAETRRGERVGV